MKIAKILSILFIVIGLITGCGFIESSEDIMKPPKLSISQEEVRELLHEVLDDDAELLSPQNGVDKNPIQFVDLNNDNEKEVVVFYRIENDKYPLRGLILTKDSGEWRINEGIKGLGNEFDNIMFEDITGNGILEIIIGWDIGDDFNKGISIYQYQEDKTIEIFNDSYEVFAIDDFDNDSISDIFLVKLNRIDLKSKGQLYKFNDEEMILVDEVQLDGTVNVHYNVNTGLAYDNIVGVFLDSGVGAHAAQTELVILKDGELENVFFNKEMGYVENTFRAYGTRCEDIDDDGIIEIPLLREPISYDTSAMSWMPWITSWYQWDGEHGLKFDSEGYYQEYYFSFPKKWNERITLDSSLEGEKETLIFSYFDEDNRKYKLFTIKVFTTEGWANSVEHDKFVKIDEELGKVYTISIVDDEYYDYIENMKLSLDEIKEHFQIRKRNF